MAVLTTDTERWGGRDTTFRANAVVIATLFIATMLAGMVDAYFVAPKLTDPAFNVLESDARLVVGALSVTAMAIGIVFIAVAFQPVIQLQHRTIALTYLVLRAIECVLLLVGPILYLTLAGLSDESVGDFESADLAFLVEQADSIKNYGYQLGMIVLALGSLFLCYALYSSLLIPRWLSVWGGIGYVFLLASALLSVTGTIDTDGSGALLYIPGGLWEIVVLPVWLYRHGFDLGHDRTVAPDSTSTTRWPLDSSMSPRNTLCQDCADGLHDEARRVGRCGTGGKSERHRPAAPPRAKARLVQATRRIRFSSRCSCVDFVGLNGGVRCTRRRRRSCRLLGWCPA